MKIGSKFITVNGKRIGVNYFPGPWIAGVDPTTIKIRPKNAYRFPPELHEAFEIENNSDIMTDYFERDAIVVTSVHPLYSQIAAAAR